MNATIPGEAELVEPHPQRLACRLARVRTHGPMHRNVAAITAAQGPELAPITFVTRSVVDDTRRFTVAHEFAHLVMDEASGPADDADVEAR